MTESPRIRAAIVAVSAVLLASCTSGGESAKSPGVSGSPTTCKTLLADAGWHGENAQKLQEMIENSNACGGSGDVGKGAPLALFDWDNTVVRNDIGDATTYWMLANGKVLQPKKWADVSTFMTDDAAQALTTACGSLAEEGKPLPTNLVKGVACADEILSVYSDGKTTSGAAAFEGYNARRIEPQYAFAAQLLAGYTEAEVTEFAKQARDQNLEADEGAEQTVGSRKVTGWVTYYEQMSTLIDTLRSNGFDVRIVSASSEPVVRVWAESLGLTGDKVMGVTVERDGDRLTSKLASCGGDEAAMTYMEGKRCRVNEQVFGITGSAAFETAPKEKRPVFAAGDSDTDVSFMMDATELKLAINRNKTELMCQAYDNEDGTWIVNPMFILPLGQRTTPYPCSTAGETLPDGGTGPLKDVAGNLIADQQDTVFAAADTES